MRLLRRKLQTRSGGRKSLNESTKTDERVAAGSAGRIPLMAPASPFQSDESRSSCSRSVDSGLAVMDTQPEHAKPSPIAYRNSRVDVFGKDWMPDTAESSSPLDKSSKKKRSFLDLVRRSTPSFRFRKRQSFNDDDDDEDTLDLDLPRDVASLLSRRSSPERLVHITIDNKNQEIPEKPQPVMDPASVATPLADSKLVPEEDKFDGVFLFDRDEEVDWDDGDSITTGMKSYSTAGTGWTGGTGMTTEFTNGTGYTSGTDHSYGTESTYTPIAMKDTNMGRHHKSSQKLNATMEDLRIAMEDFASDGRACWTCVVDTSNETTACHDVTTNR